MRKLKRNKQERAFLRGYRAGLSGASQSRGPRLSSLLHQDWINGWRIGRQDLWCGYQLVDGISRQHILKQQLQ